MNLTVKQQRFADEYIISGNATEAAIAAGYSEKTARSIGQENLTKPDISAYIEKRLDEIQSPKIADQQEVMEFLTSLMRGEIEETVPLMQRQGGQILARTMPSAQTRKGAAELIGKRYKLFTDRVETEGKTRVVIVDDV